MTYDLKNKCSRKLNGFTLLELIIVMLVMGVIMAVGLPRIFTGLDGVKTRGILSDVVTFLRETRMDAVSNGETVRVTVNLPAGTFKTNNGRTLTMPEESGISINVEDEYLYVEVEKTGLTFYPNGMASGAKLKFSLNNAEWASISLDPLTGLANYTIEW